MCFSVVPVGEASIVIAVSSPHRKEALEAVHFAIDHVKATVPIWKKVSISLIACYLVCSFSSDFMAAIAPVYPPWLTRR